MPYCSEGGQLTEPAACCRCLSVSVVFLFFIMHDMARHIRPRPRLAGSPAVPRSAQPESSLGNALHLAPLLWGFICLQHAMHRGDPFPRCFRGGMDRPGQTTAEGRPATRQKLNPRKQTAAAAQPLPELQCGYGQRGRGQTAMPGPARSLADPCRPCGRPLPSTRVARTGGPWGGGLRGCSGILAGARLACLSVGLCSRSSFAVF